MKTYQMYALEPDRIYAHAALRGNTDAMERMERFLATMEYASSEVDWFAPSDAQRVSAEVASWEPDMTTAGWKLHQPIVFTRFALEGCAAEDPVVQNRPQDRALFNLEQILGYLPAYTPQHTVEKDAESGMV